MKNLAEQISKLTFREKIELSSHLIDLGGESLIYKGKTLVLAPGKGGDCPNGYHWDTVLLKCIFNGD